MSETVTCQETKRLMERHGFSEMVAQRHLQSLQYLQRRNPIHNTVYHRSVILDPKHLPTPDDNLSQSG